MATLPYWNNDEVISSDKLNSMVQAIVNGDPLAVKVSNATKNDVNQIVGYLSSLHDKAKNNLNSATSTSDLDTAYANMTALVSNKLGAYANDDTVDLYSTGIRASIITFLQAYDTMMSNDRLNNKNTDNTLGRRIDSETNTRESADNAINTKISDMQSNGGGRNLLRGTRDFSGDWINVSTYWTKIDDTYNGLSVIETNDDWYGESQYYPVKQGETYTFSLFARYTSGMGSSAIYILLNSDPEKGFTKGQVDNWIGAYSLDANWKKCSITFTATTDGYIKPRMERTDNNKNTLQICGYMLEKGIVAHDWQPAPEDTDAEFTALNDRVMQNRGTITAPDFNLLTQAGYYTITRTNQGKNCPPTGNWGTLEVSGQVVDVNGRLNQKYVSDSGGTIYTRQLNNGTKTWTAWVQLANINNVDAKVNAITGNGGGRNLFVGSVPSDINNLNGWSIDNGQVGTHPFLDDGTTNMFILHNNTTKENFIWSPYVLLENGETYTLSYYSFATSNTANSGEVYATTQNYSETQLIADAKKLSPSGAVRYVHTFTFHHPSGSYHFRFDNNGSTNGNQADMYIGKPMLEKGVVAHDWSPAPEDFDNYTPGRTIALPNNSSITLKNDRIVFQAYLPMYFTDHTPLTNLDYLADRGEWDNLFVPSATMATLTSRPTNPDTNASLTGDCFFSNHYAYSGTTIRAFQKIYSCDYNYVFIRSYNGSSKAWTNWSCLTPYA